MVWSKKTFQQLKFYQKEILMHKAAMGFFIDTYEWWDKIYRYTHIFVAILTPLIQLITASLDEESTAANAITISFGIITAGMVKVKEYILFDKIRDLAKDQTTKYTVLFEKIEREKRKNEDERAEETEYLHRIYWELAQIEANDPRMDTDQREKYKEFCDNHQIPYEDEYEKLRRITREDLSRDNLRPDASESDDRDEKGETDEKKDDDNHESDTDTPSVTVADDKRDSIPAPVTHRVLSIAGDPAINRDPTRLIRERADTDKRERESYKETLEKFNPKDDMKWVMERMNDDTS